jgi:hypothetical protein
MSKAACNHLIGLAAALALFAGAGQANAQPKSTTSPALTIPTPAAPAPTLPSLPPSAIGAPSTQLAPIAPLSPPPITATTPSSGGTVRTDQLASPTPQSGSPSELAASTAGGGGRTLQDCIGFWDPATHMTKHEWRVACERSLHRLDAVSIGDLRKGSR